MRVIYTTIILLTILYSSQAQKHPPFSKMDVFALEWVDDPQISPDGQQIVYMRRSMDIMHDRRQSRLWIINSDGTGHRKLSSTDVSESYPRWSPSGDRIVFISGTDQGSEIFVHWIRTGTTARLTQLDRSPSGLSWSADGQQIAFLMLVPEPEPSLVKQTGKPKGAKWADHPKVIMRLKHEADGSGYLEPGYQHLFTLSADGGTARQITKDHFNHTGTPQWIDGDQQLVISGNRNANWELDFRNSELYAVDPTSGSVSNLTDRPGPDGDAVVPPDGKMIAYLGFDDRTQTYQLTRLYVMQADGSGKREIDTGLDRSVSEPAWSSDGQGLYFQYDDHGNTKIGFTSMTGPSKELANNLGGTGVSRPYGGGSFSVSDNGAIAFTKTTPYYPSELGYYHPGNSETNLVMSLNDDLLPFRTLGKVEEIWYKSSIDNRDVQGWIVKPPFFENGNKYPLLVENHGGPIANYGDRFSPEMQLYASAGFVVFYPNPRGSTSYGEEFGNLLYHNYPGDDYHDVMDGVDAMLTRDYLARDSLFVTGGSAGGIMSAWMIGKNNRFRAAAVVKPVMNWISKTLTADNYYGYANSRFPGQPWENMDTYMKFSPLSLVGNIQTPTLVMVGTSDLRTPLSESKQLYHALKIRGVQTALVEIPGSYHFISNRPSQMITKIDHIVAWFAKYRD